MTLHLVHCDKVDPTRWRNGGGRTRELLAWPTRDDWTVRISVADIDRDGPFSAYPDIDRWFAVVEGAGVVLSLGDGRHVLGTDSAPLHFRGEQAPGCELVDGATRDLNLMVRRHRGRSTLQRAEPGVEFHDRATLRALFCADAVTLQVDGSDACRLAPYSLLWADGGAHGRWRLHGVLERLRAWWLAFESAGT